MSRTRAANNLDPQGPGHERWLLSYADFMTLLMALFVVMYSISQVSEQKYRVLSQTFSDAFKSPEQLETLIQEGEPQLSHTSTPIDLDGHALEDRPGNDANDVPETFVRIEEQLEQSFQALIESEMIAVTGDERWLQIELPSEVLFNIGGVELSEPATAIVGELANALGDFNNVIKVEGFTDNVPINGGVFRSNWELSAARASAVVKLLVESGIAPQRLAAVGYGEHQPVATNETEEGRSRNRRIVLMVSTQSQLRESVFQPAEPVVGDTYLNRPALPDGVLVRGLESSALDEARAWLAARYSEASPIKAGYSPPAEEFEVERGSSTVKSLKVSSGVNSVQLDNGAILFTQTVN